MTDPVPPIRREILVNGPLAVAFAVFTDHLGEWWPLAEYGVFGGGATVAFVDGKIVEQSPSGETATWGTVMRFEPPFELAFTWHPGAPPERASNVSVHFRAVGGQTLVELRHSGWEVFAEPAAARDRYDHGWPAVLACFGGHHSFSAEHSGETPTA